MTFQQALPTVRGVDVAMRSQIDDPRRPDRLSKGHFIDHCPKLHQDDHTATHVALGSFLFFPRRSEVNGELAADSDQQIFDQLYYSSSKQDEQIVI
jgi:hypothetical protein